MFRDVSISCWVFLKQTQKCQNFGYTRADCLVQARGILKLNVLDPAKHNSMLSGERSLDQSRFTTVNLKKKEPIVWSMQEG